MEKQVAKLLMDIKAVFLRPNEPFTWASGIKSPIYCDNRLTLSYPKVRDVIEQGLADIVKNNYPALVANILGLPMAYVRASAKDHGRNNQIEGKIDPGQKVVVIEDLISTAGSVIEVVNVLREHGAEVLGIASIFTYGMQKGLDRLAAAEVKNISLSNYNALVSVAHETGYISEGDIKKLEAFQKNPSDESWQTL